MVQLLVSEWSPYKTFARSSRKGSPQEKKTFKKKFWGGRQSPQKDRIDKCEMAASSFDSRLLPPSPLRGKPSASTPMVWPGSRSTGCQNLITYKTLQTRGDTKNLYGDENSPSPVMSFPVKWNRHYPVSEWPRIYLTLIYRRNKRDILKFVVTLTSSIVSGWWPPRIIGLSQKSRAA